MEKYLTTKNDCYELSHFFKDINIDVNQYHFIFIFQAGMEEDIESMKFCQNNGIKYLKFFIKDKKPIFSNSNNIIIESLIFNNKSYSLVNLIKSDEEYDISNDDEKFEYSLNGQKRQKIDNFSKIIFFFGNKIYNKIKDIIGLDFELSDENFSLEENKYFYVYYKDGKKKEFFLKYFLNGIKTIVNVMNEKESDDINEEAYQSKLKKLIKSTGFKFKCLLMNSKNKKVKNNL